MAGHKTYCTLQNSEMLDLLEFPLAVVAHDAGAANHIIAWCQACDNQDIYACVDGPAAMLWAQSFPAFRNFSLPEALNQSRMLLTGTGWGSSLEHDARKLARYSGIKSVAVIDHWTNYRERFVRQGEQVLPDEIWVVDIFAKKLAEEAFSGTSIRQLPNCYLDHQVADILKIEKKNPKRRRGNILYVLEPIRQTWGNGEVLGEFQALDFFINNMAFLGIDEEVDIRLKPHPSDPAGKYDDWAHSRERYRISVDGLSSLAELIAWSDMVVGCQTYALVVAAAAGKRVVSSIPPWATPCVLPQSEIIRLSELVSVAD